jgi:hypothetical protein
MPDKTLPQPVGSGIETLPAIAGGLGGFSLPVLIQHLVGFPGFALGFVVTIPIPVDTSQSFIIDRGAFIPDFPSNGHENNLQLVGSSGAGFLSAFVGGDPSDTILGFAGGGLDTTDTREYHLTVVTFL